MCLNLQKWVFLLILFSNSDFHVYVTPIFLHLGLLILFNVCTTETIESEDDVREFVKAKIESLVANVIADQDMVAETETNRFKSATTRFHRIFNIPVEEKLVNCKLCTLQALTGCLCYQCVKGIVAWYSWINEHTVRSSFAVF